MYRRWLPTKPTSASRITWNIEPTEILVMAWTQHPRTIFLRTPASSVLRYRYCRFPGLLLERVADCYQSANPENGPQPEEGKTVRTRPMLSWDPTLFFPDSHATVAPCVIDIGSIWTDRLCCCDFVFHAIINSESSQRGSPITFWSLACGWTSSSVDI